MALCVKVRPDTVVHVWKGGVFKLAYEYEMHRVTSLGYKTLLSSCSYLSNPWNPYVQHWHQYYLAIRKASVVSVNVNA